MNAEIKEKWVAALRSGEYAQGTGVLRRRVKGQPDEFCCLGVLCALVVDESEWVSPWGDSKLGLWNSTSEPEEEGYVEEAVLPIRVVNLTGLDSVNPSFAVDGTGITSLAKENDSGRSFSEIADLIEEYL